MEETVETKIGGKTLSIQTGKIAKQASGSVVVRFGDTVVLVTVVSSSQERDVDFLRGQAKNKQSDLEFNDWSLREPFNSKRAEYIKQGIRDRIKKSSVTIVYISDKTI